MLGVRVLFTAQHDRYAPWLSIDLDDQIGELFGVIAQNNYEWLANNTEPGPYLGKLMWNTSHDEPAARLRGMRFE